MDISPEIKGLLAFINQFKGESVRAMYQRVGPMSHSKNCNAILVRKIFSSYQGAASYRALYEANHLLVKTIQLNAVGYPKESMSFPKFEYRDLVKEHWETSTLKQLFSRLFLLAVFQAKGSENVFLGAFPWVMPEKDLNGEVKEVWIKTVGIIETGNIVISNQKKLVLAFPKESETKVCHVRPHGKNSLDLSKLPSQETNTQYLGLPASSFWLNRQYVYDIVQKNQIFLR